MTFWQRVVILFFCGQGLERVLPESTGTCDGCPVRGYLAGCRLAVHWPHAAGLPGKVAARFAGRVVPVSEAARPVSFQSPAGESGIARFAGGGQPECMA